MVCIQKLATWARRTQDLPTVQPFGAVLLGDPGAFRVIEAINPHMQTAAGDLQKIDSARACQQWNKIRACYQDLGLQVSVLPPQEPLADACFTANPSLVVTLPDGTQEVWLARMAHHSRRPESNRHRQFFQNLGLPILEMPAQVARFEGCGDGVWHPGRFLLHAGIGPRSDGFAWTALQARYPSLDILLYRLQDPRFYHLDTALAPLDERRALWFPPAFDAAGQQLVQAAFPEAIAVSLEEALNFAANAHCPDGQHVLIDQACPQTIHELGCAKFTVRPLDTSEFRKSGGSVYCLKLSY
jgi:arginine dihydrolase